LYSRTAWFLPVWERIQSHRRFLHPAVPGGTLLVTVEANPEVTGVFEEVIMVKCNCERMIKLIVSGDVL
jgi:hypothetical protein